MYSRKVALLLGAIALLAPHAGGAGAAEPTVAATPSHAAGSHEPRASRLGPSGVGAPDPSGPNVVQLDSATVALNGAVANLDPLKPMTGADVIVQDLVSGKLLRLDENAQLQNDLVETVEVSEDGLTYTMHLLPDLVFSDGTPLSAQDVVYSFEQVRDAPLTFKALTEPVDSVQAPDDRTVIWTLSRPFPDWMLHLALHFGVIHPREQWSADPEGYFGAPVSAGPYVLAEGRPGDQRLLLVENPNYPRGPVALREIEIIAVPDVTSRTLQLAQGDLDFVTQLAPSVRGSISPDVETFTQPEGAQLQITFNGCLPDDHPLRDRDVREAISLAIDRDDVSQRAFFGIAPASRGIAPMDTPHALPNLPGEGARDLDAARALLDGTEWADGFEFTLLTWGERPGYLESALIIKEQLAEIGIEVTVENVQVAVALERMDTHNFEANFGRAGGGSPLVAWLSNLYRPGTFWGGKACYDNPEMTDLLVNVASELDDARRDEMWRQIHDIAYREIPFVSVVDATALAGTRLPREVITMVPGRDLLHVGSA